MFKIKITRISIWYNISFIRSVFSGVWNENVITLILFSPTMFLVSKNGNKKTPGHYNAFYFYLYYIYIILFNFCYLGKNEDVLNKEIWLQFLGYRSTCLGLQYDSILKIVFEVRILDSNLKFQKASCDIGI